MKTIAFVLGVLALIGVGAASEIIALVMKLSPLFSALGGGR
jgi:hypothetical protein